MVVDLDTLLAGDIQDILQLVDIPLILVILLLPVQATLLLLVGDIPLLLEATPLFQVTHLLVATLLPLVEAIHHLQEFPQGLFLGDPMVFLLPLGVMAHNHMVKHLLKVVMELHLQQVAMEGLLLLVVMVRLLVVMEVRLLQEDMEGILLQVDMGHNLPQLDMDPTLDISPHNRTIAHKLLLHTVPLRQQPPPLLLNRNQQSLLLPLVGVVLQLPRWLQCL